jgi:hypothetical protein
MSVMRSNKPKRLIDSFGAELGEIKRFKIDSSLFEEGELDD